MCKTIQTTVNSLCKCLEGEGLSLDGRVNEKVRSLNAESRKLGSSVILCMGLGKQHCSFVFVSLYKRQIYRGGLKH